MAAFVGPPGGEGSKRTKARWPKAIANEMRSRYCGGAKFNAKTASASATARWRHCGPHALTTAAAPTVAAASGRSCAGNWRSRAEKATEPTSMNANARSSRAIALPVRPQQLLVAWRVAGSVASSTFRPPMRTREMTTGQEVPGADAQNCLFALFCASFERRTRVGWTERPRALKQWRTHIGAMPSETPQAHLVDNCRASAGPTPTR